MIPGKEFLGIDYRAFGALESVASGTGIAARARELLKSKRSPEELSNLISEDVFEAARKGEDWARIIIHETVDTLSIAIANLVAIFDPELVVLGGGVSRSADLLIEPIRTRIAIALPNPAKLVVSDLGLQATVMGAITNVLHNTSNFYVVHKLS
jgi:glucokinase